MSEPGRSTRTRSSVATKLVAKVLAVDVAVNSYRRGQGIRATRAWRRRVSDRAEDGASCRECPVQKYLVCNSDESEPGTCHDREVLRTTRMR